MDQAPLLVESLNDAIRYTVSLLGGPKKVGARLWPAKDEEQARKYLDDCLNIERAAKLSPEEVLTIARWARLEKGVHLIAGFFCSECGYAPPVPIDPEDQKSELLRQFNEKADALIAVAAQIKRMGPR